MLCVERQGSVRRITLDRPEVRNAFNAELIAALTQAFLEIGDEVRAVVLAGNGPAFCAGGDLNWMRSAAAQSEDENRTDARRLAGLFAAVRACPAAVVVAVHGACFGGGTGLAAAADIAVAEEGAQFAFSEVRLGLIPATIAPFVLAKLRPGDARAWFVSGMVFDAATALRLGLVHATAPPGELAAEVNRWVHALRHNGPEAMRAARDLVVNPADDLDAAADRLAVRRASAEAREGIAAFLEKRRPAFAEDPAT